jgi:putative glutathione S-transferase
MGMLVHGKWSKEWYQPDEKGRFQRPATVFRNWISADGSTGYEPEAGRYHLYISYACPWAHRTLILRKLKGLEEAISISVVNPLMTEDGWTFNAWPGVIPDSIGNKKFLREVYTEAVPDYTGRVTVPLLWDKKTGHIVNNESRMIMRMFDHEFESVATIHTDYAPPELHTLVDQTIDSLYEPVNNGVYRAGFATEQEAYNEGVTELFAALDHWDKVLDDQRYLCGERITEADWCFFTTLLRFDPVYYVHFKCNVRHISEYRNLQNYLRDLYQQPGIAETCHLDHIKTHYYMSHPMLNPMRIVPKGPKLTLDQPHDRGRFDSARSKRAK